MSKHRDSHGLRSTHWFGAPGRVGFTHRSWMRNQGIPSHAFDGRPIIGICNTWSELSPCNAHLRQLAEHVRRGIYEMGGWPLEFPVMGLGETLMRPSSMLFRNLVSMDVEESIRANPLDGVVLLAGCDKTTPALLMGASSCNLPTIVVSGGPMASGRYRGERIGSGTHIFRFVDEMAAGNLSAKAFLAAEAAMSPSAGTCNTMGTASTMAAVVEALGVALPDNAAIPATDSRRKVLAHMAGRRIVEMVHEDLHLSRILVREAFANAIRVTCALGGSTNAVIHLLAIAGRVGIDLSLDDWDRMGREIPCLVDLMPSGKYLMEDFFHAGGLPAVMKELGDRLHRDVLTVTGATIGANIADAVCYDRDVIRPISQPFKPLGGIAVLRGNLAPQGAVLKPSAASPDLLVHRGRAVVFEDIDDYRARIDAPDLDVGADDILVLRNCGPKGYPGFPEVGNMKLPDKLLRAGVRDMVRISDARMSGTAYGTVVLHVAPEAAAGGPLALVRSGDWISMDVPSGRLQLEVEASELSRRQQDWRSPEYAARGYSRLYQQTVLQADRGADLDFLVGASGCRIPRESH